MQISQQAGVGAKTRSVQGKVIERIEVDKIILK